MTMINRDLMFKIWNFFHLDTLKIYNFEYVIYNYKKIIFKKVYIFNKYIYDYVLFLDEIIVRENLFFCFREIALN